MESFEMDDKSDRKIKAENKRFYVKAAVLLVITLLFSVMSFFATSSMRDVRGNARVINYIGIVRGATQRLVKKELMGQPDDALIARLDSIVNELITGEGPNGLIVLDDPVYLGNMSQVQSSWRLIKEEIARLRADQDKQTLYAISEEYFFLVDRTVSSAEEYSEGTVRQTPRLLIGMNMVFALLFAWALFVLIRLNKESKNLIQLQEMAFVDSLTGLPNRTRSNQYIDELSREMPDECLAVFVFGMNFIKKANDALGHQGGDRLIVDFSSILSEEIIEKAFLSRYAEDEFLAILRQGNEEKARDYLQQINERVVSYNLLHINDLGKINFTVGYCVENRKDHGVSAMIEEADRRMFVKKRQMKESDSEQE